jgi:hypothetical protein
MMPKCPHCEAEVAVIERDGQLALVVLPYMSYAPDKPLTDSFPSYQPEPGVILPVDDGSVTVEVYPAPPAIPGRGEDE